MIDKFQSRIFSLDHTNNDLQKSTLEAMMLDIHASMLFLAARIRAPSGSGVLANGTYRNPAPGKGGDERVRLVAPRKPITNTI